MTAQFPDIVMYQGAKFELAGINGTGLFEPETYGFKPTSWCTACWRGYLATYQVKEKRIFLQQLEISLTKPSFGGKIEVTKVAAQKISGIEAHESDESTFEYSYRNMNLPLPFEGGILIARDFIRELCVRMGFHPAWKYQQVRELIFKKANWSRNRIFRKR